MGIGNALKSRYRKYLNNYVSNNVFQNKKDPYEGIDLSKALVWLGRAFNSLNHSETITKCFAKAGFTLSRDSIPVDEDDNDFQLLREEAVAANPPEIDVSEVLTDEKIDEFFQQRHAKPETKEDDEEEETSETLVAPVPVMSSKEASVQLGNLEAYFISQGMFDDAEWAGRLSNITRKKADSRRYTPKITEYFEVKTKQE